jgi:FkbM family methyltransferase
MGVFTTAFLNDFFVAMHNLEPDNWDDRRFPADHPRRTRFMVDQAVRWMQAIIEENQHYEEAFAMLADDTSRALMIKLLEYDVLDHHHVRLPLSRTGFLKTYDEIDATFRVEANVAQHNGRTLDLWQLPQPPVRFVGTNRTVLTIFLLKQYFLGRAPFIQPRPGDICLDAGSCRGEVALHFAHTIGPTGHVYAFEFVPGNLVLFARNMELNPQLAARITPVKRAVWNQSGKTVAYAEAGPATQVKAGTPRVGSATTTTVTIDDFTTSESLPRVDFIKMDIEGAEIPALAGATATIRQWHPRLAICAYHRKDDLYTIPALVRSIDPAYRFYLDHYTIHAEETVIYGHVADEPARDR